MILPMCMNIRFNFRDNTINKNARKHDYLIKMPENYEKFVNLVRRSSNKNIPRGCRTSYVCGLNDQSKDMYEDYQRRFAEDPFNEDTVRVGDALLDEISEAQRRKWKEMIELTDFTHSSRKVPTTPACTWWNRPEEDNSSGKLESTHPSRTSVKSDQGIFLVSSQSCVSTLTHYSSELLLPRHQGL